MDVTLVRGNQPRAMPMSGAALSTSAPATGNAIYKNAINTVFQAISAAAATIIIEGSHDNVNWVTLGTITLAGAGTDKLSNTDPWNWVRARTTAATTATTVLMGG